MSNRVQVDGIFPHMTVFTSISPDHTESGIGTLMPWGGKLWFTNYVADIGKTDGSALYSVDENMEMTRYPDSVSGTWFNRLIIHSTREINIGPYLIDENGNVRIIRDVAGYRLAATMYHLTDPDNKVYMVSMEGKFWEVDLHTLKATELYDLYEVLGYPGVATEQQTTCQSHIMNGVTAQGKVYVCSNAYSELEFSGQRNAGRLAEWDGKEWTILERKPFNEVAARGNWGQVMFASGWDRASVILKVLANGQWTNYRLPKSSMNYEHHWATETTRIREVETESFLMDAFGLFYDLCPIAWEGKIFGVRPICSHLRKIPDFCSWRGMLVLAGDQVSPLAEWEPGEWAPISGDPQSNLWFGKTDDLWSFGKPQGWGGPWWNTDVKAGEPSDMYLMLGFDHKVLHVKRNDDTPVRVQVQIDFTGLQEWVTYQTLSLDTENYAHLVFPEGFSAQWVRLVPDADCNITATFIYT